MGLAAGVSPGPLLALVISSTLERGFGAGLRVALAATLWAHCIHFNRGRFAGGFLQYDWLASAVLGVALFAKRRHRWAGIALSWAVMTRGFPAVLALLIVGAPNSLYVGMLASLIGLSAVLAGGDVDVWEGGLLLLGLGELQHRAAGARDARVAVVPGRARAPVEGLQRGLEAGHAVLPEGQGVEVVARLTTQTSRLAASRFSLA